MPDQDDSLKPLTLKEALDLYENGKHRRYTLLFAVNAATLAIAQLMNANKQMGGLTQKTLAVGMAVLTLVLIVDIWKFGQRSRTNPLFSDPPPAKPPLDLFSYVGQFVLGLVGLLITTGWLIVGYGFESSVALLPSVGFIIALITTLIVNLDVLEKGPPRTAKSGRIEE